jgi:hypothetical protein
MTALTGHYSRAMLIARTPDPQIIELLNRLVDNANPVEVFTTIDMPLRGQIATVAVRGLLRYAESESKDDLLGPWYFVFVTQNGDGMSDGYTRFCAGAVQHIDEISNGQQTYTHIRI